MKTREFYYHLPPELIAQEPLEPRDASRLLCLSRDTGALRDRAFRDLPDLLRPGDCLIVNDSRVLPARLYGMREASGAGVELLLLRPQPDGAWEVLAKPGRRVRPGDTLSFGDGLLRAEVLDVLPEGSRLVRFLHEGSLYAALDAVGEMPLPHYIKTPLPRAQAERYQTVYAREQGSAAAPTAGLHFTPALLESLRARGVAVGGVTLHVGLGTFRPVKAADIADHHMHTEHYRLPEETAALINRTRAAGGRVIAVGTTACRTLESVGLRNGAVHAAEGDTGIFLYPGCDFHVIDGLITNFHLPESTLIMLVSAFAGHAHTMAAYAHAVGQRYRFYSFGDAMLVL